MQKQKSRSKHESMQKRKKPIRCMYCQGKPSNLLLHNLVSKTLVKKYNECLQDQTASSEFNYFLGGLSLSYTGGVREFLVDFQPTGKGHVQQYYNIDRIKVNITRLVRKIASKSEPTPIHFHSPFYIIKRKQQYEMMRKKERPDLDLFDNSAINARVYTGLEIHGAKTGSRHKNAKDKSSNKSNSKGKNKYSFKPINQSQIQIRKLCRSIGSMTHGLPHQNKFKEKLMLISQHNRKQSREETQFKTNLMHNFSAIQKQPIKRQEKLKAASKQIEQLYGISNKKPKVEIKISGPYSSKRAETQKIQILADSPVTHAYYTKDYNYTETGGPIKIGRKERKQKRHSFSPYSLKSKKSTSKRKNQVQAINKKSKSKSTKAFSYKKWVI